MYNSSAVNSRASLGKLESFGKRDSETKHSLHRNESGTSLNGGYVHSIEPGSNHTGRANKSVGRWTRVTHLVQNGFIKKLLKQYNRKRRDWPVLNFIMLYGVKQAAAVLFLADIISDILVASAFFHEASIAEQCKLEPGWARSFAVASLFFILLPLGLTALFLNGMLRRKFVRRKQLQQINKFDPVNANFSAASFQTKTRGMLAYEPMTVHMGMGDGHTNFNALANGNGHNLPYSLNPQQPANSFYRSRIDGGQGQSQQPPPGVSGPGPGVPPQVANAQNGAKSGKGIGEAVEWRDGLSWRLVGAGIDPENDEAGWSFADATSWRGMLHHRAGPVAEGSSVPRETLLSDKYAFSPPDLGSPRERQRHRKQASNVEQYVEHSARLADEWDESILSKFDMKGGNGHERKSSNPSLRPQLSEIDPPSKAQDVQQIEFQALMCGIVSMPVLVMAAVGLDVAMVLVSLYPPVATFIDCESIMPAYHAYRILVEVVLEALPQVLLQLTAWKTRKPPDFRARGTCKEFTNNTQWGFSISTVIQLSLVIAILNLVKTLTLLFIESSNLEMGILQYIRYLGEVGSTRLPLRSIAEDTIGRRLHYDATGQKNDDEMLPLVAALRNNKSIKLLSVQGMKGKDIVRLMKAMESRCLPYSMDIVESSFSMEEHMDFVIHVLCSKLALNIAFRSCNIKSSHWLRQEAFMYMRMHLPSGCTDDNQVPVAHVESDPVEVKLFSSKLLEEWVYPCKVLRIISSSKSRHGPNKSSIPATPVDISMTVPQRIGTMHAALYFLSQNITIASFECTYPVPPAIVTSIISLLKASHGLAKLKLVGTRAAMDEATAAELSQLLSMSHGLRKVSLLRLWGDPSPSKAVLAALEKCSKLGCDF